MVSGTAPERSWLTRGLSWSSSVLVSLSWLTKGGRRLGPLTTSSSSESESRERSREPDEPREFPGEKIRMSACLFSCLRGCQTHCDMSLTHNPEHAAGLEYFKCVTLIFNKSGGNANVFTEGGQGGFSE